MLTARELIASDLCAICRGARLAADHLARLRILVAHLDGRHLPDAAEPRLEREQRYVVGLRVPHERLRGRLRLAPAEVALLALDDELAVVHAGQAPAELPVRLHALLEVFELRELVGLDRARASARSCSAILRTTSAAVTSANVALLRVRFSRQPRSYARNATISPWAVYSGSIATISPAKAVSGTSSFVSANLMSRLAPMLQRLSVTNLPSGSWSRTSAVSGSSRLSRTGHVEQAVHRLDVDRGAVEQHPAAGDGNEAGHQASSRGTVSGVPRRSRSGSSMSLASAIVRQRVASPYAR